MAAPTQIAYTNIDDYDRHIFDHVLPNDTERFAFILFFEHVDANFKRAKRPRTGRGRVRLWDKSRLYWVRKAQAQQPLPAIQHPAAVAPAAPVVPVAPVVPAAPVAHPHPAPPPLFANTPVSGPSNTPIGIQPTSGPSDLGVSAAVQTPDIVHRTSQSSRSPSPTSGTKRARDYDSDPEIVALEPPAKRRLPNIGGERCPPFVLHNGPHKLANGNKYFSLAPSREQREFVQTKLGGTWRYAKTLCQRSIDTVSPRPRWGVPPRSTFLFVKIDDHGVIQDRAAVKCTDVSWDKDTFSKERAEREDAVIHAIPDDCRQLPRYRGLGEQTMNFTIDGAYPENRDPSCWKQRYTFSDYAPHGDLYQLIENHARAKRIIPEHFIWYVFKQLVDALICFGTGYCTETHDGPITVKQDGWRRIFHLDLKADNVLIANPDPKYASYWQPILTDFDSSIRQSNNPQTRQVQLQKVRWFGARHWQAPEQSTTHQHAKNYKPREWKLDHWTDIYSLGLLIRHMMLCADKSIEEITNLQKKEADMFPAEASSRNEDTEYELAWKHYPETYTTALIRTVHKCLAFRAFPDPTKPKKKSRPTLNELQDRIKHHLERLDAMCGDQVTAAQHDMNHPLHVLFPAEDSRYAIGQQFVPEPNVSLKELTLPSPSDADKFKARDSFTTYSNTRALPARKYDSSGMPRLSVQTQELAVKEVVMEVRQDILRDGQSAERDLRVHALDHASTTILKCVNPNGMFKQLKGQKDSAFFAPESKHAILAAMQACTDKVMSDTKAEIEKEKARMTQNEDDDELMEDAPEVDGIEEESNVLAAREEARARREKEMNERMQVIKENEAESNEKLQALELLREAAELGIALLVLGEELELDEELVEEHWMTKVSKLHMGVWEYFWSRPDGVFILK